MPELKRVIVAYGNSIVMEENLEKSLNAIFGSSYEPLQKADTTRVTAPKSNVKDLISQASRQFDNAQQELKRGNWAGYGAALQKVEQLLKDLGTKVQ